MSGWYEAKEDNISIDDRRCEVDILVLDNKYGSVYLTLTFDQVKEIYEQIINPPKELEG